MRKTGAINPGEVRAFQRRHELIVDGKFGNQCMGQLLQVERVALADKRNASMLLAAGALAGFASAVIACLAVID